MKQVFFAIAVLLIASCDSKNPKPEPDNATLIIGQWKETKSIVNYTSNSNGSIQNYDATQDDGPVYITFKNNKDCTIAYSFNGVPDEYYTYSISGNNLILKETNGSEEFQLTIQKLNNSELQWKNTNGAGGTLEDINGNNLGTINYAITDFAKQ
ncbi:MAG TPA: lipocalin family protein [Edaphocola sp.]|nr:lipocalin family protein [Edaphocola sp.]